MSDSIYRPESFLEECLDYQAALAEMQNSAAQDELGAEAGTVLGGRANYLGEKRVIIGGDEAYVASRVGNGRPRYATRFEDILAKGRLGNPEYFHQRQRGGLLALSLYDAQTLRDDGELLLDLENADDELAEDPTMLENRMPTDRPLRLPILFPVQAINLILCASGQEPHRHSEHVAQNQFFQRYVPLEWQQAA